MAGRGGGIEATAAAQDLLGQALVSVLEGDLERAELALRTLARRQPPSTQKSGRGRGNAGDGAVLYLALARIYRRRGEIGRAIQLHQNLLLRESLTKGERQQALGGLAEDFRSGGFLRRAEASYEETLAADPNDTTALAGLLRVLDDRGELRRAADVAARLARVSGDRNPRAEAQRWCGVARTERAEGRNALARKAVARALRGDRGHGAAWLLLGELEAERGRTRKALAAWRRAAECDPASAAAAYPKIEATHAVLGRPRDTERLLRQALERDPGDHAALLALCRILAARGDFAEANALLEKVGEGDGVPLAVTLLRARLLLATEDIDPRPALDALLDRLERELVR